MRCLTGAECAAYLTVHGVNFDSDDFYAGFIDSTPAPPAVGGAADSPRIRSAGLTLSPPSSDAEQFQLVTALFNAAPPRSSWMIWLLEWGLWSGGFDAVWMALREGSGESRPIIEAPGHLFGADEAELAAEMVRLALASSFDAHLVSIPAAVVAYTSHDEYMEVYTPESSSLKALGAILESLALRPRYSRQT